MSTLLDIKDIGFTHLKDKILDEYKALQDKSSQDKSSTDYIPNLNDDETLLAEAIAYRFNLLLQSFNTEFDNLFLQNTKEEKLDRLAKNFFGIERLKPSKPSARITFTLPAERTEDSIFRQGSMFRSSDDDDAKIATLQDIVIIKAGTKEAEGIVELQERTETSSAKTIIPNENFAFPYSVEVGKFSGGGHIESDALFRERCINSLHSQSTAGSRASYDYHVKSIDSRIKQVNSYKDDDPCKVYIRYYVPYLDVNTKAALTTKIKDKLNGNFVRPLGIELDIDHVTVTKYKIKARVTLPKTADIGLYTKQIQEITDKELEKLSLISKGITHYQLLNIIGIDNEIEKVELEVFEGSVKREGHEDIDCLEDEIIIITLEELTVVRKDPSSTA